jgi:hypothetical protein
MLIDQYFSHFHDEYKFTNINPGKKGGTSTGNGPTDGYLCQAHTNK